MSHVQHSHPGRLPTRSYNFLSEATVGWGCRSQRVFHSFLRILLRSLSRIILSLPEPTVRCLGCPAGPTFQAVVTRLALVIQPDCEQAAGDAGGGQVGSVCAGGMPRPRPHSSEHTNAPEAPGSRFSTTLGNLSWVMTRTHLVSMLPNTI